MEGCPTLGCSASRPSPPPARACAHSSFVFACPAHGRNGGSLGLSEEGVYGMFCMSMLIASPLAGPVIGFESGDTASVWLMALFGLVVSTAFGLTKRCREPRAPGS